MRKNRNKVYKWIAMMLTAALLAGQCQMPVLANEGIAPAETGVSDEHKDGVQEGGSDVTDKDTPKGDENDGGEGGAGETGSGTDNSSAEEGGGDKGNGGTGEAGAGSENGGPGEDGDGAGNGGAEEGNIGNGGDGSGSDNGSGGDGSGSDNGGADDDGEDTPGAGGDEDQGGEEGAPDKCVCETACTEDAVNEKCPVCVADYNACVGEEEILEETVSENDLEGDADVALMAAGEGVEVLAIGDEIIHDGIKYVVIGESEVEVTDQGRPYEIKDDITIPGSFEEGKVTYRVTAIGTRAFFDYVNLKSIKIPKGVTSIGASAFYNCGLRSLELPEGVTSIGDSAFKYCRYLRNVIMPESLTSIGRDIFHFCGSLMSIELSKNITNIERMAFCECIGLTSVTVTENVEEIQWGGDLAVATI